MKTIRIVTIWIGLFKIYLKFWQMAQTLSFSLLNLWLINTDRLFVCCVFLCFVIVCFFWPLNQNNGHWNNFAALRHQRDILEFQEKQIQLWLWVIYMTLWCLSLFKSVFCGLCGSRIFSFFMSIKIFVTIFVIYFSVPYKVNYFCLNHIWFSCHRDMLDRISMLGFTSKAALKLVLREVFLCQICDHSQ